MTEIDRSIPETGCFLVVLYGGDYEEYPVEIPYEIDSDSSVTIDLSIVRDVWERGMMDDLIPELNKLLKTRDYELKTVGLI